MSKRVDIVKKNKTVPYPYPDHPPLDEHIENVLDVIHKAGKDPAARIVAASRQITRNVRDLVSSGQVPLTPEALGVVLDNFDTDIVDIARIIMGTHEVSNV
jgi:hypothetical protein